MIEAIHHDVFWNIRPPAGQCFYKAELKIVIVLLIALELFNQPITRFRLMAKPSSHH
jgi:hypothetical protein